MQQIYSKADAYAVSRMFYSLLRPASEGDVFPQSSINRPHYEESEIPEIPKCYSEGLRYILHNLVLDDPLQRLSARRAMLWYVLSIDCMLDGFFLCKTFRRILYYLRIIGACEFIKCIF